MRSSWQKFELFSEGTAHMPYLNRAAQVFWARQAIYKSFCPAQVKPLFAVFLLFAPMGILKIDQIDFHIGNFVILHKFAGDCELLSSCPPAHLLTCSPAGWQLQLTDLPLNIWPSILANPSEARLRPRRLYLPQLLLLSFLMLPAGADVDINTKQPFSSLSRNLCERFATPVSRISRFSLFFSCATYSFFSACNKLYDLAESSVWPEP